MLLFTTLIIILVISATLAITAAAVYGAAFILVFGDVLVCAAIIALIIRHFIKKKFK